MKTCFTLAALTLLTSLGFAGTVVTPNAYSGAEAPANIFGPLGIDNFPLEFLIAGSQFSSVPVGSQITALGLRLDGSSSNEPSANIVLPSFTLELSTSLNPLGSLSGNFANNIGSDAVTVLSGPVTITAGSLTGGNGPNPFYFLNFTTPYIYTGGNLLVTLIHGPSATGDNPSFDAVNTAANLTLVDSALQGGLTETFNTPVMAFNFTTSSTVPEPSTILLLSAGLAFCVLRRKF